jgi:hypothetical protein
MTKKQIKNEFKSCNVQLGSGAMESIEDELYRMVHRMAKRCHLGNVKRLTPDLMWIALGRHNLRK